MRSEFQNWMKRSDNKKTNVAYQYALSIEKISRHYFEKTGNKIDLYGTKNIDLAKTLSLEYGQGGRYAEFGNYGKGTIRNAIKAFVRFLESKNVGKEIDSNTESTSDEEAEDNVIDDAHEEYSSSITYERDLHRSLVWQVDVLFPGYKIFGSNQDGIEYSIGGKRIDLLLENISENSLLAIELKAGTADFRVFGQISMYLGLLSKSFPNKNIKGVVVAGEIDDSLKNACLITDKVSLFKYKMQLLLEEQ